MAGERVLVVEDNEMSMKLFRDVLVATGYRTLEATTGGQAVTLATEHAPDLVNLRHAQEVQGHRKWNLP